MQIDRVAVWWVVLVVLGVTALTGPVGVLQVPAADPFVSEGLGEGSAAVEAVSLDGPVRLQRGDFEDSGYFVRAPTAAVEVASVTGKPMLVYRLDVGGIYVSRRQTLALAPDRTGRHTIDIDTSPIEPSQVQAGSYEGTLAVDVRGSDGRRTVARRNVTVEVIR